MDYLTTMLYDDSAEIMGWYSTSGVGTLITSTADTDCSDVVGSDSACWVVICESMP